MMKILWTHCTESAVHVCMGRKISWKNRQFGKRSLFALTALTCVAVAHAGGCARYPSELLPTPSPHRAVEIAPEADAFGPLVQPEESIATVAASPEARIEVRSAAKPVWWFDGKRTDTDCQVLCVEALAQDMAGARHAVTMAAREAFEIDTEAGAGAGQLEIRELSASPLAHPGGALRYVAYAMVARTVFIAPASGEG